MLIDLLISIVNLFLTNKKWGYSMKMFNKVCFLLIPIFIILNLGLISASDSDLTLNDTNNDISQRRHTQGSDKLSKLQCSLCKHHKKHKSIKCINI